MPIRRLDNETIGKIAAGEVVERPASVVKELLENAIDAGATRLSIAIEDGGSRSIEVIDNGSGMSADDLLLAFERHATSKLGCFEDLDRLRTLGFRGEAVPSIAAVSRMTIRSRPPDRRAAATVRSEFGQLSDLATEAGDTGTRVLVEDLFENVPARRKFLRQASTESAQIVRIVGAYAAAYPSVAVELTIDGRRSFGTSGRGDLLEAAGEVFGADVGRSAITLQLPEVDARIPGVELSGWLCSPATTRSHRQQMIFFLNGRLIAARSLQYALEEAYHTLLMVGRHPVTLVRIEVDPDRVDVNVHPSKSEVRFEDERAVARAISRAAHATLTRAPQVEAPPVRLSHSLEPASYASAPFPQQTFRSSWQTDQRIDDAVTRDGDGEIAAPNRTAMPLLRVLGQVASTYIIAEGPEGLYLVDQHAAHERVVYERFLGQMAEAGVDRQPMLDPIVLDLAPHELTVVEQSADELAQVGFDIDRFGPSSIVIRSVPTVAVGVDIEQRFRAILQELSEGGAGTSWLDSVAVSVACHTSIRAGQTLSLPEMRALLEQLERTQQPRACGHGRPTMLRLTQDELERQFGRG